MSSATAENYLQCRYQINAGNERYLLYENTGEKLSFGFKNVREGNFQLFETYLGYQLSRDVQVGAKYATDSFSGEYVSPVFRFMSPMADKFFSFFEALHRFDLKGGEDRTDLWLQISTLGGGWFVSGEVWFYHQTEDVFVLRPIKIGHRFKNGLAPFIMAERKWCAGKQLDSVYVGTEITF